MQQNLSIKVALAAIDKMTQPLNAARKASQGLATSVKATQDNIKNLERQAKKFDAATTAVKKAAGALEAAREKSKALRMEFGKASERTDEQKAALKALSQEIGKLTRSHRAEVDNLNRVRAGFYRLGVSVREGSSATEQISRRTAQYNAQLEKEEASLKRVTAAQASYDKAKKLQGKLASVGVKSAAAGGAILWGGMHAMHAGFEFDRAYSQTLADAQLTRGSGEGQALRDQAKLLARTTHYSAVQATQGQDALINGGMTAGNARQALPGVLNMALAAHAELGQAANVGSSIFDAFQINPDQMDRVSDVLVATFTRSKTSLESLGETMKYVGPVARQAGMSLESTSAAAAMLAKNGIEGSMAGTGLKSVINGLYAPAKEGAGVLGMLHINTVTATGAVRPLVEVLQELYQKTRRFNQGSQLNMFKALFGEQGMGAAQILAESAAKGSFQSFQDYLLKAKGIAAKTSRTMTDNFEGDMQMLHSAWDGLWTQMEEGADSPLRKVVQWVTKVIQGITTWMQAHPKLTSAIVDTALAMGALLAVAGTVLTVLAGLLGPLAAVRLSVALLAGGEGVGMLSGAIGALGGVADAVMGGIAAVIGGLTLPVVAVAAILAAAAVAIIHYWEPIKAFFSGVFDGLLTQLAPVIASLRREWRDIGALFSWLWDKVVSFLTPVHESKSALDRCAASGNKFGEVLGKAINAVLTPIKWLNAEFDKLLRKAGIVPDLPGVLRDRIDDLTGDISAIKSAGDEAKNTVPAVKQQPQSAAAVAAFGTGVWTPPSQKHKGRSGLGAGGAGADANPNRLGDIVFKQLPAWVALNHGFAQPRVAMNDSALASTALSAPVAKKSVPDIGTNVAGDINVHIHIEGAAHMDRQQLVSDIERQVVGTLNKLKRQKLASLKDRE